MDPTSVRVGLVVLTFLVVALAGSTRRLGLVLTLLLSLVLTPLGGFIAAWISGPRQRKPKRKPRRTWFRRRTEARFG